MHLRSSSPATSACWAFLCATLVVCSAGISAYANELSGKETAARQTAVRVLDALKPIEAWVENVSVAPPPALETKRFVEVTGSRVNLRAGPTVEASVLGVAEDGDVLEYVLTDGDWYQVYTPTGRRAYVSRRFSQLEQSAANEARTPDTELVLRPGFEARTREILGRTHSSVTMLRRVAASAESDYQRRYGSSEAAPTDADQRAALKSLNKIRKYRRVATEKYSRYAVLVGDVEPVESSPVRPPVTVRGTIRGGIGSNTRTDEIVGSSKTETDVTRTEFAADITADLSPDDKLTLNASRREEIRFAPISQTRGTLGYARKLSDQATVGARVGLDQYKNDANDQTDVDRSEIGVHGTLASSERFRANADLSVTDASYPNNDVLDYKDTRIALGAGGVASPTTTWGAEYTFASHDLNDNTATEDNTRDNLRGNVTFKTGERTSLALGVISEGTTFDSDNNPGTYRRTTLELRGRSRGRGGASSTWVLAVRAKGHDVSEDRNFTEFRGDWQSRRGLGSDNEQMSKFKVNYRNYKGKDNAAFLDYIEGRWDSRRARPGILWESNTYMQYFIKNGNADRNARVNQFAWLGIVLGPSRSIVVGPHIAANTILVTVKGSDLGVFENPSNTVRYGVKGTARIDAAPVRIEGRARWEKTEFYNIDNSSAPTRIELEGNAIYAINQSVDATARLKYYTVGIDDPGRPKTTEVDVLFGVVYHLGRTR